MLCNVDTELSYLMQHLVTKYIHVYHFIIHYIAVHTYAQYRHIPITTWCIYTRTRTKYAHIGTIIIIKCHPVYKQGMIACLQKKEHHEDEGLAIVMPAY